MDLLSVAKRYLSAAHKIETNGTELWKGASDIMAKVFNVNGACSPLRHYMVDLGWRLEEIKKMVDDGQYFTVNRARQYGKTTLLRALNDFLKENYLVVSLDFQRIESAEFVTGSSFVHALTREINKKIQGRDDVSEQIKEKLVRLSDNTYENARMGEMFGCFSEWCAQSESPLVLIIDEVDTASNNQVFLDFLAQLRAAYLDRDEAPTFQSVILAGVYDVRNIKQKIRPDAEHKTNSPWNTRNGNEPSESLLSFGDCLRDQMANTPFDIATDFLVEMNFCEKDIVGMLKEYEADYRTGMNISEISRLIYDYTSGYPYLVSRLCKFIDERIAGNDGFPDKSSAWTRVGLEEAVKLLAGENNPLFQSLTRKLSDAPVLRTVLYELLFTGKTIPYVAQNRYIDMASMLGFIKNDRGSAVVSNRIFETVLYNLFISEEFSTSRMYDAGVQERNRFIVGGHLDMKRVLEKFVETFDDLYGDRDEAFLEDVGRRYFMLFLKPIINGVGNCYVEAQTRNRERMDLVIDYRGEQSIVEMKVWRTNAYNERGQEQLSAYLDYFHLKKGYMLSFNFNKRKEVGVKEIMLGNKLLVEAVV